METYSKGPPTPKGALSNITKAKDKLKQLTGPSSHDPQKYTTATCYPRKYPTMASVIQKEQSRRNHLVITKSPRLPYIVILKNVEVPNTSPKHKHKNNTKWISGLM